MTDPTTRNALLVPLPVAVWERVPAGDHVAYMARGRFLDLATTLGPTVLARLIAEHVGLDVSRGVAWGWFSVVTLHQDRGALWIRDALGKEWQHNVTIKLTTPDAHLHALSAVARQLFGGSDV